MTAKISNKKNQKPIEYDIHLKYICKKCGQPHWLSFKEASTKNYKIVCDCNHIFKVKRVTGFKLKYDSLKINKPVYTESKPVTKIDKSIPKDLLDTVVNSLVKLGFTVSEAKSLVTKSYSDCPTNDIGLLVKQTLESLKNVE
ncbi:MAG: hypothetical protein EBS93_07000 [Chitinophagia bacterium]|nr:hypothetical protein [Chitinophagia bacterium]NCA30446.1 hypothetical protein [Chitinophagia bacterium]